MHYIFNELQKTEYLDYEAVGKENPNTKTLTNYFKRMHKIESKYNKDAADMNETELRELISSLNISRQETRGHFISLIRGYISWAKMYGKTNNNSSIDSISPESFSTRDLLRSKMIASPQQLENILSETLDYKYYENRAARDELILRLLYSGMKLEELRNVKKADVDYDKSIIAIKLNEKEIRKYCVDDKILDLCSKCSAMEFIERRNWLNDDDFIECELVRNEYLFRPVSPEYKVNEIKDGDDRFSISTFISIVKKMFEIYSEDKSFNVTPLNIRNSGIFYQLYLLEKDGNKITSEMIADKFDIHYKNKDDLYAKTRRWKIDFEDWKLAFGYM